MNKIKRPPGRPLKNKKKLPNKKILLTKENKPPDFLDRRAKAHWREILKTLLENNIVNEVDGGSFAAMCEAFSEYVRTLKLLKGQRPIVRTTKGNWIQNPLVGIKNQAAERYLKFACQFGMTPAARAKLAEIQVNAADKLKKYMS